MPLTLAQMHALIADGGNNTAEDVRDVIEALWKQMHAPWSLDNDDDVWWQGDLGDFTEVNPSGNLTPTEGDGFLSVFFEGQSNTHLSALLKARTFVVGDSWSVAVDILGNSNNHNMAGLVFTDGVVAGSNCVAAFPYNGDGSYKASIWHGTLNNLNTNVLVADGMQDLPFRAHIRIDYVSANTWQAFFSPDGVTWTGMTSTSFSKTMTPTHFGLCLSRWNSAPGGVARFSPIIKLA